MGIFGALTTAVSGLRAQSYALENISGNIANSQTTAFKRTDTSFTDLIPDNIPSRQVAGAVISQSRATNTVQGDIQSASNATYMAMNGDGYFVVSTATGTSDGQPLFSGTDTYTRRGDFEIDKNGFLVNGAGYYLKLLPIDRATGNVSGSVPEVMPLTNDILPARATSVITYRGNLPLSPTSGLVQPSDYANDPRTVGSLIPFVQTGVAVTNGADLTNAAGGTPTAATTTFSAPNAIGTSFTVAGQTITLADTDVSGTVDDAEIIAQINSALATAGVTGFTVSSTTTAGTAAIDITETTPSGTTTAVLVGGAGASAVAATNGGVTPAGGPGYVANNSALTLQVNGGASVSFNISNAGGANDYNNLASLMAAINDNADLDGITASITGGNQLVITSDSPNHTLTASGAGAATLGIGNGAPTPLATMGSVQANESAIFEAQSISGDAITIYDAQGTPVQVQLRWAKVDSATEGGQDTWNLFYKSDSNATGTEPMWTNVGQDFTFVNSQLTPPFATTTINDLTVDGVPVGDVTLSHGSTGLTQYSADNPNTAKIITLNQDGYRAGEVVRVQISDGGRITAFYSNGQMADIAEIPTVFFNADNALKRLDGGAFQATYESGPPIPGAPGTIIGSSLEGSNTDIADEFTKLIVTQQAYSANTRIVSTADEMLQEALGMVR